MSTNIGYEPDNNTDGIQSAQNNASSTATNSSGTKTPANESTHLNSNLETYFSDEKIRIPDIDKVSL